MHPYPSRTGTQTINTCQVPAHFLIRLLSDASRLKYTVSCPRQRTSDEQDCTIHLNVQNIHLEHQAGGFETDIISSLFSTFRPRRYPFRDKWNSKYCKQYVFDLFPLVSFHKNHLGRERFLPIVRGVNSKGPQLTIFLW